MVICTNKRVLIACTLVVIGSGEWQAPIRKTILDTNRNGHIEEEECICDVGSTSLDPPRVTTDNIDYSVLKKYEAVAYSIAAAASAMDGDIDPQLEIALLSDMLYQDARGILGCWLGYTPDSYGTAFNKTYDMAKSVKLVSQFDCAHVGGCDHTNEHVQEDITVRFFDQLGRNATLHFAHIYAKACCDPVSYGDYLGTSEGAWIWNYFSPDQTFDFFNLPLRDYLYGNTTWLNAGKWSEPYIDPVSGATVSFGVPFVTRIPVSGSVDPFIFRDTRHAHPGFMKSFESLYVLGVAGVDVRLNGIVLACTDGFYSTYPTCSVCPLGSYRKVADPGDGCLKCAPGSYTDKSGSSACTLCLQGYSQNDVGRTSCDRCPPGTRQHDRGMATCSLCDVGRAIVALNASDCDPCRIGQYSTEHGTTACLQCPKNMTTGRVGAVSVLECICDEGTFLGAVSRECQRCPLGMTCNVGSVDPLLSGLAHTPSLLAGYYSSVDDPLSVFFCGDKVSCPGGVPGTCGGGHIALACQSCEKGQYESTHGDCQPCEDAGIGPFVALVVVGLTGAAITHIAVNIPFGRTKSTFSPDAFFVGLVVNTILSFNVYANLDTTWAWPMSDLFSVLRVVAFDLTILKFSCVAGSSQLMPRCVFKLLVPPSAFLVVALCSFLLTFAKCTRDYAFFSIPDLINSAGLLVSFFFIALCLACVEGFMCAPNPNGLETLINDRSVPCWNSEDHAILVALSIIGLLVYPLSFLVVTGYCVWKYSALVERFGTKFTLCSRFLIKCWKPQQYYFGIMYTIRNLVLTLAPITYEKNYDMQLMLIMLIILMWLMVQLSLKPWRCEINNRFDAITSAMQIVVLTCFALVDSQVTMHSLGVFFAGIIAFGAFALVMMVAFGIWAMSLAQMFRRGKEYGLFLSHHKGADALYARQIKLMLAMVTSRPVFLDVDNLASLDELVALVCNSIDNLVVMLSPETLSRFWCAVEIICATKHEVSIILTSTHPSENVLCAEFLARIPTMWGSDQILEFHKIGIQASTDTEVAYKFIATLPIIRMMMKWPESAQMEAVTKVVAEAKGCKLEPRTYKIERHLLSYIVYNKSSIAQASCARILCMMMKTHRWNCLILDDEFRAPEVKKAVLLILVSQGLPRDPIALGHVCYLTLNNVPFTTIVSQEDFQAAKPSEAYMKQLREGSALNDEQLDTFKLLAPGLPATAIADLVAAIYSSLAASLNPQDSEHMLLVEVSTIVKRAEHHLASIGRTYAKSSSASPRHSPASPSKRVLSWGQLPSECSSNGSGSKRMPWKHLDSANGSTSPRVPGWKGWNSENETPSRTLSTLSARPKPGAVRNYGDV